MADGPMRQNAWLAEITPKNGQNSTVRDTEREHRRYACDRVWWKADLAACRKPEVQTEIEQCERSSVKHIPFVAEHPSQGAQLPVDHAPLEIIPRAEVVGILGLHTFCRF